MVSRMNMRHLSQRADGLSSQALCFFPAHFFSFFKVFTHLISFSFLAGILRLEMADLSAFCLPQSLP